MNIDILERSDRYVLVSPCRDEAAFLRRCIESVLGQTLRPAAWIIVDDGSTDGSRQLLDEFSQKFPWMTVVTRVNRGSRSVGPGVVEAFEQGLECVDLDQFEYLCKFDLDLVIPERYFETLVDRMTQDPRLGSCSGKPYCRVGDTLVAEKCGDEMSVGMTKFYRIECFRQIGGLVRGVMWDGIDCHRARMCGWIVASWDEDELRFEHLRAMGSSDRGLWRGRMRHGAGQYFMGTGFVYMFVSAIYRIAQRPYFIGSVAMIAGYVRSWWGRHPQYDDLGFRGFLSAYQRDCLLRGKRAATLRLDAQARLLHFKSGMWSSMR